MHTTSDDDAALVDEMLQATRQQLLDQLKARRTNPSDSPVNKIRLDAAAQSARIRDSADAEIGKLVAAAQDAIDAARRQLDSATEGLSKIRAIQQQAASKQDDVTSKADTAVDNI